jgi:hypothetical protein
VGDVPPPDQTAIAIAILVPQVEDRPFFSEVLREAKTPMDRLSRGQIHRGARVERLQAWNTRGIEGDRGDGQPLQVVVEATQTDSRSGSRCDLPRDLEAHLHPRQPV